jgi:LacI family transcriptional regulator
VIPVSIPGTIPAVQGRAEISAQIRRRVTIDDIARHAGVARTTVSRALNDRPDVDPRTRERITEIAERLGYVPSDTAKVLRTGRSYSVGLACPSFRWPGILQILRGVSAVLDQLGYRLMLFPLTRGEEAERDLAFRVMPSMPMDGLILILPPGMLRSVGELANRGVPVVLIDDRIEHRDRDFPSIGTTNVQGAFDATRHLLNLGRRRIAIITGPMDQDVAKNRLAGYRRALEHAGLPYREELVVPGTFEQESGTAGVAALLGSRVPFDAIFASNDFMAFGAQRALHGAGLSVPEDVALVGFDDMEAASFTVPALTTVRQPLYEMGSAAARTVIAAVEGREIERHIEIPALLIVRESCGAVGPARESGAENEGSFPDGFLWGAATAAYEV